MTNEKGEIIVKFTVPEALTRWKMLGFAHTKDLKSGLTTNSLVTQKDIMVVPNQPRFFRENDKMKFSAKISSLVDKELPVQAQLQFFDALTMKPVDNLMKNTVQTQNFSLKAKQSTSLEWSIEIPEGLQAITYRIVAKAGDYSDGEEMVLPVVTNRMLVTETMPLPIRGKQTKTFKLDKLVNNTSATLRHQRYTLEFTSNPAWYAIQALPYLMEYPYDCVEQTFSKYYANSIASHIANANPRIKRVFDAWKNIQPDALLSNLEKNQELKSALLEETLWVLQAKDESQRKRMVGVLFDLNRMANEQARALDKIVKAQAPNGGFSWFPGFPEDRYMTQHIMAGMGHLDVMGVKSVRADDRAWQMVTNALEYLDSKIKRDYDDLKDLARQKKINLEDNHISYIQYHYLYSRSYFKDVSIPAGTKEAFDYFAGQAKKYWLSTNMYTQGMACLALHRFDDKTTTAAMIKSFSERALHSEEMGMYWKNDYGYYWYQAPIETQALMMEVYDEVMNDQQAVEDMKVWLLKQKQTQDWKTTKATVEACYALLRRGTDALANTALVEVKVGNETVDPAKRPDAKVEAGTGYFKTAWQA
ncbi:MAG TPA: alpha-2-macroglobulin family protein, partial [Cyclobacteriaceae bacterium]|nr:alpha-2-macroglobulin family protein [Cyclobacteriaceae bacterium]